MSILIVEVESRDACAKHIHRIGILWHVLHARDYFAGNFVICTDPFRQLIELVLLRQATVPKQKNDLFKGRMLREIVNIVTLIDQFSFFAINIADRALSGDNAPKSGGRGG